ncbi:hypothetical protein LOK49_Contig617G00002 [Camellia lanceoleosa]|nr:hypothetical protein LOK49_Contig617G00002 [Camellia lanceoleosa]
MSPVVAMESSRSGWTAEVVFGWTAEVGDGLWVSSEVGGYCSRGGVAVGSGCIRQWVMSPVVAMVSSQSGWTAEVVAMESSRSGWTAEAVAGVWWFGWTA